MQTGERSKKEEEQQPPWRTEPEIEVARQEQLTRCLATAPDIQRGIYPFKGMKLSRADVEWLLVTYQNEGDSKGRGNEQNRRGLDLRGADLRYVDLHGLPLARLRGSLTREEWEDATAEQRAAAVLPLRRQGLRDPRLGLRRQGLMIIRARVLSARYRTLTYFRSTRGRGSPANTLPDLSTVPNSGPLPVVVPGLPP